MRNKKRWIYAASAIFVAACFLLYFNREAAARLGFQWFLSDSMEKQLEKTYKPAEREEDKNNADDQTANELAEQKEQRDKNQPFSILLFGVDARGAEQGRADMIMYTVVRPADGDMLMISIPRDSYVELVGRDTHDKINHAYAFGGAGMAMDTVEKFLDAPVQHYATINFEGFMAVVDEMGGISLPIEKDIENNDPNHEYFFIKGGQSTYNGQDALNYMRYREDAGGDVSRTGRHQQFINALVNKATGIKQWSKIPEMIDIMGNNFSTDLRPNQITQLVQSMLQADTRRTYTYSLTGEGRRLTEGGAWYYFIKDEDLEAARAMISNWLDGGVPESELLLPNKEKQ